MCRRTAGESLRKLDLDNGSSWTATLSHELLEMLADPWINWCATGNDSKIYALEVCDAVEADDLGYDIDGVRVSDFVTPAWFEPTCADRLDFKKHVSKELELAELELARGGYISILDPARLDSNHRQGRRRSTNCARQPPPKEKTDSSGVEEERSLAAA